MGNFEYLYTKSAILLFALFVTTDVYSNCVESCPSGREIHVSSSRGNDSYGGEEARPLKTIQAAANIARPGDVITVHEGVYREWVNPPVGGETADKPIIYQAAGGEYVEIKGSERIKNWKRLSNTTWSVAISNNIFAAFNPYADTLKGDWLEKGKWAHTGEVYLNDRVLTEAPRLENVLLNKTDSALWFCKVTKDTTYLWANFGQKDPNEELTEINVRQAVFYPEKPFVNYIVVRGFRMSHAATPWAPPTAEQIGLVGTHWSKGWIIENNTISHSKCVGITLGKYGDEWDNKSESVEGYIQTTQRALENGWDEKRIGNHLVRNNHISYCGQAGIAGSLGAVFSRIETNVIHDIGLQETFWGYELAGIKLHAAVDVMISGNHIYRTEGGIWLDWMAQGTRIKGNLLHDNQTQDLSLEVNHGPILIDHNLFLSPELAQIRLSQGVAFVNNLIAWEIWPTDSVDKRETPYLEPHGTSIIGFHDCPCGNVSYFNNIFMRTDLTPYDQCRLPVQMKDNVFWSGAIPSIHETMCAVDTTQHLVGIRKCEDGWYLQIDVPESWEKEKKWVIPTVGQLRYAIISNQAFDKMGGLPVSLKEDYWGKRRKSKITYCPGPIEFEAKGLQMIKVFCEDEKIVL